MRVNEGLGRDILRLIIWYPFRWMIIISPVRISFVLMKLMGDIHFFLSNGKKKLLADNLSLLRGFGSRDLKIDEIIRRYFENHYIDRLHIFLYPRFNTKVVDKYFRIEGLHILEQELLKGKGCILLQGHFGPIQIPLYVLASKGYNIKQIGHLVMPENLSYIGEMVSYRLRKKYEARIPAEIMSAKSFLKKAYKFLKENNLIMMTGDGAAFGQFIGKHLQVPFLGRQVLFPVGAIDLSQRTGSPIIPLFIVRESTFRFTIVIEKPLALDFMEGKADLEKGVEKFAGIFEKYVKKYPCHWHLWDELGERTVN